MKRLGGALVTARWRTTALNTSPALNTSALHEPPVLQEEKSEMGLDECARVSPQLKEPQHPEEVGNLQSMHSFTIRNVRIKGFGF